MRALGRKQMTVFFLYSLLSLTFFPGCHYWGRRRRRRIWISQHFLYFFSLAPTVSTLCSAKCQNHQASIWSSGPRLYTYMVLVYNLHGDTVIPPVWGSVKVLVDETSLSRSHAEVRYEPANSSGTSLGSQWAPSEHGQVASPSAGLLKQLARENSCPLGDGHECLSKRMYALKHRQRESMWNVTATWTAILDQLQTAFPDSVAIP